jgi:hypothetical protein
MVRDRLRNACHWQYQAHFSETRVTPSKRLSAIAADWNQAATANDQIDRPSRTDGLRRKTRSSIKTAGKRSVQWWYGARLTKPPPQSE